MVICSAITALYDTMNMDSGEAWLTLITAADLPLSDPRCVAAKKNCTAYSAAANASQAATPYAGQFEYGKWATYYYVVILFLLTVLHLYNTISNRRSKTAVSSTASGSSISNKAVALWRFFSYRHIAIKPITGLAMPALGMCLLLLTTLVFLIALVAAERPYFRMYLDFGSPPLGIRSGLMAFACVPVLVALAGKANIVTVLTGISHEKLNIVHRSVAWMCFSLALVHSLPFFVQSYRDGVFMEEFYKDKYAGQNEVSLCLTSMKPRESVTDISKVLWCSSIGHAVRPLHVLTSPNSSRCLRSVLLRTYTACHKLRRSFVLAFCRRARLVDLPVRHSYCLALILVC